MFESLANLFGAGGSLQTGGSYSPDAQKQMDNVWGQFNSGKIDADTAAFKTGNVEKGSILGMTPSSFANLAGQAGAAISPKGSWQQQLGSAASQMGSQKVAQLAQAEKEKRMTELLKQMFGQAKVSDLTKTVDPNHPMGTSADAPMKGSGLGLGMQDFRFSSGGQ